MGVNIKKWSGVFVLATLLSSAGSTALAEEKEAELPPLRQSSIPEVMNRNADLDDAWENASILGDFKWNFGIEYEDNKLAKDARRINALYIDLLEQRDRDNPAVRTRDLPNPYDTSLFELKGL